MSFIATVAAVMVANKVVFAGVAAAVMSLMCTGCGGDTTTTTIAPIVGIPNVTIGKDVHGNDVHAFGWSRQLAVQ